MKTFAIGDRVVFAPPQPQYFSCRDGQVVPWHGEHDPREPRVRWSSGFGTSVPARELRLMTEQEISAVPPILLVQGYDTYLRKEEA